MTTGIALALLDNESCDLVGSAHPTYQYERMAASVTDKIRSHNTLPALKCGFASWFVRLRWAKGAYITVRSFLSENTLSALKSRVASE
ncbi:hypothetical protein HUF19_05815 [Thalassolituus hydrocarboniclasticus]|uniref:Uncharacterized protein n=2 Tax=Thalassolituus hydrocarboniclasticus TaxID=2742796 RepID=A0ABY6A8K5_9GAMM|nr:hypothetical protein HUF19_05815 [Thalassolituus hydrocarboniclasticus]